MPLQFAELTFIDLLTFVNLIDDLGVVLAVNGYEVQVLLQSLLINGVYVLVLPGQNILFEAR